MARASTERYRQSKPLSVLDGVPVAVKDELGVLSDP
jgi:Asp-tRNA(Asn)/Glu-tRNA(Gln) amidotransferase A subunit family amidase